MFSDLPVLSGPLWFAVFAVGGSLLFPAALAQPQPTWSVVPRPAVGSRSWRTVTGQQLVAENERTRLVAAPVAADEAQPRTPVNDPEALNPWILGVGGGARIGVGEPTYPMVYGRVGHRVSRDLAFSLRPRYIFGNSNLQGKSNDQGAFQMPLTADLRPDYWISPYLGGGIATATDSTSGADPMLSMGVDLRLGSSFSVDLGLNYIFQSQSVDSNSGDVELTSVLYLRF